MTNKSTKDLLEVPEILVGKKSVVARSEHAVEGGLLLPHVHHSVLVQVAGEGIIR